MLSNHGSVCFRVLVPANAEDEGNSPLGIELPGHWKIQSLEWQALRRAGTGRVLEVRIFHPIPGGEVDAASPQDQHGKRGWRRLRDGRKQDARDGRSSRHQRGCGRYRTSEIGRTK